MQKTGAATLPLHYGKATGVGRALNLISELIYDRPPSYRDPARFSFAHGDREYRKDGDTKETE
jgi:hypothetical protein